MGAFSLAIQGFVADTKETIEQICLGIVLEVGDRLVFRSPVDTGFFRANWRFAMDAPDRTVIEVKGTSDSPAPPPGPPDFTGTVVGRTAFWTNSVVYGPALEEGHSQQRPQGFVRITVQEYRAIVAAEAARSRSGGGRK